MATIIRKETRKRGFFGWAFLILFVAFNALMLFSMVAGIGGAASTPVSSEAGEAGRAIGTALGAGVLLLIWVCGAVILGLFALLTRGRRIIVEETAA